VKKWMRGVKISASEFAARMRHGISTSFVSFGGFLACLWVLDGCQAGGLTYLPTVCVSCTKVTGQGLLHYVIAKI
jgi:hypothetical protein